MNKRADGKYLSAWWFFVLAVIAGGIVIGVLAFNFAEVQVKKSEADILASRVLNCIIQRGELQEYAFSDEIFRECDISQEMIYGGNYLISIEIYKPEECEITDNFTECKNAKKKKDFGISNFKEMCTFRQGMREARHYPECSEILIHSVYNKEIAFVHVLTGSNQDGGKPL